MSTVELTEESFASALEKNEIVLIDFWASWCAPCRQFAPTYEKVSEKHPEILFAKVDTEAQQRLAAMANITSIPTLMAFREKVLVFSQAGAIPAAALEDLISQVEGLDMDEVRSQMAQQSEKS